MAIVRDEQRNYVTVTCDTCGTEAPKAADILKGHGLINMGWYCRGGTHICGGCPQPVAVERALAPVGGRHD